MKDDPVKDCIDAAIKEGIPVVKTDKHELNALAGQRPHQVRPSHRNRSAGKEKSNFVRLKKKKCLVPPVFIGCGLGSVSTAKEFCSRIERGLCRRQFILCQIQRPLGSVHR